MKQIEFFFDYLSPYSYLAFSKFLKLRENFKDCEITYTPIIMSQVIHSWETKGPAEIAPKRDYLMKNCLRIAKREETPFKVPLQLPFNSLDALRYSMAVEWKDNQALFIEKSFQYCWQDSEDTNDFDRYKAYMLESGFDLGIVEVKALRKALKLNTKRAIELKLFGVPTFLVRNEKSSHDELFWGNDSVEDMLQFINGKCSIHEGAEYKRYLDMFTD